MFLIVPLIYLFKWRLFFYHWLLFLCFFAQAQNPEPTPNTIDVQFKNLIEESNNFQDYKVIKQAQINELRKNTNEHITKIKREHLFIRDFYHRKRQ